MYHSADSASRERRPSRPLASLAVCFAVAVGVSLVLLLLSAAVSLNSDDSGTLAGPLGVGASLLTSFLFGILLSATGLRWYVTGPFCAVAWQVLLLVSAILTGGPISWLGCLCRLIGAGLTVGGAFLGSRFKHHKRNARRRRRR